MAKTLTVLMAVLVGGLIDLGSYRFMSYLQSNRLSRPLVVLCRLLMIAVIWIGVPVGEYYACSSRASVSAGYLAAFLFFIAGFMLVAFFGERRQYLHGLRKLDKEDQQVADPADGSP
jgi:hypothetical protein